MSNIDPNAVPAVIPAIPGVPVAETTFLNGVLDYLKGLDKSHATAVGVGALAAKSAYTKMALVAACAFLKVQW